MNKPKCSEIDYINFLIACQKLYSCSEAEKVLSYTSEPASHDSINRLLYRLNSNLNSLWEEAKVFVELNQGILVYDDSTLDKLYAHKIELVAYHWLGKHHAIVKEINRGALLWTNGDRIIPCDYRIYDKEDKNNPTAEYTSA
ncbi:MAG: transposase family protein [Chlamydiales bacterium]|jgi:hypothetical protein|nr:transposase family protein [Chlamydiales bacterium]